MNHAKWAALVAIAGTVAVATLVAKEPPASDERAPSVAGIPTPAENDVRILNWLQIDCECISTCAEKCQAKLTNPELKQAAEKVVADHKKWHDMFKNKYGEKISAYPPTPRTGLKDETATGERTARVIKDDGAGRDGRLVYAPTDFVAVKRKVADHMQSVAEKAFSSVKSGEEFDNAFLHHMVMGHESAIASIDAVKGNASKELSSMLDQAREGLEGHLKMAKDMCEKHMKDKNASK